MSLSEIQLSYAGCTRRGTVRDANISEVRGQVSAGEAGSIFRKNAVNDYLAHHHQERNHQGLYNQLIIPMEKPPDVTKPIQKTERLGGMLNSYRRAA